MAAVTSASTHSVLRSSLVTVWVLPRPSPLLGTLVIIIYKESQTPAEFNPCPRSCWWPTDPKRALYLQASLNTWPLLVFTLLFAFLLSVFCGACKYGVRVCVCLCVCVSTYIPFVLGKPECRIGIPLLVESTLFTRGRVSHWTWNSLFWVWLKGYEAALILLSSLPTVLTVTGAHLTCLTNKVYDIWGRNN